MRDAFYFSHDSNAKDDPKIMLLVDELGLEGYGIFWVLIEELRNQEGYMYPLRLVRVLARRYNTTEAKMQTVIKNYDLFKFTENDFFFSESLLQRMRHLDEKRRRRQIAGAKGGRKTQNALRNSSNASSNALSNASSNASSNALSIAKASKVNKSKEKDIAHFANTCFSFEEFWETYKRKKDRARAEKAYSKISEANRQKIKDTLEAYVQNTEVQFRKYPVSYLNGENWNDEINVSAAAGGPMGTKPRILNRVQD